MIEGTIQDLQNQHRQVGGALEADQRENNSLKERTRIMNNDIAQLRKQLERLRNEARQQKGMVAINKKQLATNEGERDKIKSEISDLSRALRCRLRVRTLIRFSASRRRSLSLRRKRPCPPRVSRVMDHTRTLTASLDPLALLKTLRHPTRSSRDRRTLPCLASRFGHLKVRMFLRPRHRLHCHRTRSRHAVRTHHLPQSLASLLRPFYL
jgi:hypothetical protein